ncbi:MULTISPECIES: hypothetical protein [unclassified Terrabacter]|uniref:hypothetical protein n=1 Tax=unclassified Terrabacter TaxID=2630222 RepID=UPI0006F3FE20|nr:hypothetical protein ASD90_11420 [Terrabacter sp. Root181]KRF46638.1 hypothetical protein ASG96_00945 [Terrabacter sp. Soil810]
MRRFDTDKAGYAAMLAAGRRHGVVGERVWAVEGCNGIGRHIAHRLVHDGERVVDVPPKLSAQVRIFATGNGRKTGPVDAHSVALAALYAPAEPGLRPVVVEDGFRIPARALGVETENGRSQPRVAPGDRGRLHPGGRRASRPASARMTSAVVRGSCVG